MPYLCSVMEDLENILPAAAFTETPPTQMSSKDFQRMLYTWFEEKGLVADLRSYLRVLMINELRHTTVGKVESRSNFSLSKQAFSLVLAEHLLREGCYYTLSVFSTEAPGVANQLPFSVSEAHRHESWRFDQDTVTEVLELIGVSKGSSDSLKVASLYFRNRDSLLSCLVNCKTVLKEDLSMVNEEDYLRNVLKVLGVPSNMIDDIKNRIERDFVRQIEELTALLGGKNRQIKVLVDEQNVWKKESRKVTNELKEARKCLKQVALKEHNLSLRELQITEKLKEIKKHQSLEKTNRDKVEVCLLNHCTESCEKLATTNEELRNEIERLRHQNREKTLELERLHTKIASLSNNLQNSKLNIDFLNTCLLHSSQINLRQEDEVVYSNEESSENLTGEILKQVRSKLNNLERESVALDVKFKQLKLNDFVTK